MVLMIVFNLVFGFPKACQRKNKIVNLWHTGNKHLESQEDGFLIGKNISPF